MSSVSREATLDSLLVAPSSMVDVSVAYIMVWLSLSEGQLLEAQRPVLARYLKEDTQTGQYAELIYQSIQHHVQHLAIVCQNLQQHLDSPEQQFLIEQAIKLVDCKKHVAEADVHILWFLADLFDLDDEALQGTYRSETRRMLYRPGDPSNPVWWEHSVPPKTLTAEENVKRFTPGDLTEDHARQILGLAKDADPETVKQSYRKLAQQYHPDRNDHSAVDSATANAMFVLVKQAYEVLRR